MRKFFEIAKEYINASSKEEMLKYENLLYFHSFIPIFSVLAVFNIVFYPLFGIDFRITLINTGAFLAITMVLVLTKYLVKSQIQKSYLIIATFSIFLIVLFVHYYEIINDVVWGIAAIFVVISMGRNDYKLLIFITVDMIILTIYAVIRYPMMNQVHVFISRCISFAGLILVVVMIKKIHTMRIKIINSQLSQSVIFAQISSDIILVNQNNYKEKIMQFLESFGNLYDIERISVFGLSSDKLTLTAEIEWDARGVDLIMDFVKTIDVNNDYWWNEQIESKQIFVLSDVDKLNAEDCKGKAIMQSYSIKSMISLPILMNDDIYGFLIINTMKKREKWRFDEKRMMTVLANILGDAYLKIENEKTMRRMAYYDVLTGLPNRFMFNEKLDELLEYSKISKSELAVIFIDLDSFKSINDTLGHKSGDELLKQLAKNLTNGLEDNEMVARFGGDEFVVLRTNCNGAALLQRMKKLMALINEPIAVNGQKFYITASAGVAMFPNDGDNSETLVKNADLALYEAKELGKNQFKFFDSFMKEAVEKRVRIENMLNQALEHNEFVLYYQPQVNLNTKKIVGVEALIRWNNPDLGMISPGVFIPLAEHLGLIHSIGKWVLETALCQNKQWQKKGYAPVRMAVNLSVEQFRNPQIVTIVKEAIAFAGVDAKYVELEVTESIAIKETNNIFSTLRELKDLGLSISIDDFGTEYSSLARIKNLPIDRIKIAMEFIQGITVSKKDEAIAKSIITLANSLELSVIAEGVETELQLSFLENKMCEDVQGFYFYKPMPAQEIERIFSEQR